MQHRIVLFDGECNFCSSSVQFIIKRDRKGYFKFASLQSDVGIKLKRQYHAAENLDSIVLIDSDKIYYKSDAALRICRNLDGIWKIFSVLIIIPRSLRDILYDLIAKNRYKWFGKKEQCMIPNQEMRDRFLKNH